MNAAGLNRDCCTCITIPEGEHMVGPAYEDKVAINMPKTYIHTGTAIAIQPSYIHIGGDKGQQDIPQKMNLSWFN